MIKSAMRSALKESLLKRKQEGRNGRAKSYVNGKGLGNPHGEIECEVEGGDEGLQSKVADAEEDAMEELSAAHPSEYEGSPEEEMSESMAEAREEGDPPEYRDPEYWREEQAAFMKNKPTVKPARKSASFVIAVGMKPNGKKPGGKKG